MSILSFSARKREEVVVPPGLGFNGAICPHGNFAEPYCGNNTCVRCLRPVPLMSRRTLPLQMRSHHAAHVYAAPADCRVVLCPWEP